MVHDLDRQTPAFCAEADSDAERSEGAVGVSGAAAFEKSILGVTATRAQNQLWEAAVSSRSAPPFADLTQSCYSSEGSPAEENITKQKVYARDQVNPLLRSSARRICH